MKQTRFCTEVQTIEEVAALNLLLCMVCLFSDILTFSSYDAMLFEFRRYLAVSVHRLCFSSSFIFPTAQTVPLLTGCICQSSELSLRQSVSASCWLRSGVDKISVLVVIPAFKVRN